MSFPKWQFEKHTRPAVPELFKSFRTVGDSSFIACPSRRRSRVEDEAEIRRFVRLSLELDGFDVYEADGVKRGLVEAGTRHPDLVILDLGLPDGDGVDLIRDLRAWSDVPVLVLSARTSEEDKIGALDAGADDYLVKPFSAGELSKTPLPQVGEDRAYRK